STTPAGRSVAGGESVKAISRSDIGGLLGNESFNPATNEPLVPESAAQLLFQRPDRNEVLWRTWVSTPGRGESRQHDRGQVCKHAGGTAADVLANFEPDQAVQVRLAASDLRQPEKPGVAGEAAFAAADGKKGSPRGGGQGREQRHERPRQIQLRDPLDEPNRHA